MNSPPGHPTLLRHHVARGLPYPVETVLELPATAYSVEHRDDWWIVRITSTGEPVYMGPGPVEVFVSPAPF